MNLHLCHGLHRHSLSYRPQGFVTCFLASSRWLVYSLACKHEMVELHPCLFFQEPLFVLRGRPPHSVLIPLFPVPHVIQRQHVGGAVAVAIGGGRGCDLAHVAQVGLRAAFELTSYVSLLSCYFSRDHCSRKLMDHNCCLPLLPRAKLLVKGCPKRRPQAEGSSDREIRFPFLTI